MMECGRCIRTARFATISRGSRAGVTSMTRTTRFATAVMAVALFLEVAARPAAAQLSLTNLPAPQSFSPNGDGQEDTLDVGYYLTEAANVDITVYSGVTAVRTLESGVSHNAGWHDIVWDGKNTAGSILGNGDYSLVFHAANDLGSSDASYDTAIDSRIPGTLVSPQPGNTLSGTGLFDFQPTTGFDD